jgi:hypothetical protein
MPELIDDLNSPGGASASGSLEIAMSEQLTDVSPRRSLHDLSTG